MQSSTSLRWDDVQLFLALCRAHNLGEAAAALGVDGSTVSRRLTTLEDTLATNLFERSRNGITATQAAERLMPIAEEMEHAVARFSGAAEALERKVEGLVRIACPPDAAEVLVAPLLPELLRRYPGLRVELAASDGLVDVARRAADLAIRTVRPDRGDLVVTRLLRICWLVAASPAVAHQVGRLKRWEDVSWIGWGERLADSAPGRWFQTHLRGVEPLLRSDNTRVQIVAVASGMGAAMVPDRSVAHYGLVPLSLSAKLRRAAEELPENDVYLITHRALRTVPRVRAVWDFLVERNQHKP